MFQDLNVDLQSFRCHVINNQIPYSLFAPGWNLTNFHHRLGPAFFWVLLHKDDFR